MFDNIYCVFALQYANATAESFSNLVSEINRRSKTNSRLFIEFIDSDKINPSQPVCDYYSFRQRIDDPSITAPDAIDDASDPSQETQTYINTNVTNISSAKRTSTQAMLPECIGASDPRWIAGVANFTCYNL